MATLEDDPERVSVMYYGSYGTGKTTCAATLAHEGIVKYIRPDKGARRRALARHGIPVGNIEPIDNFDPIMLEKTVEEWRVILDDDPGAIAGVVIDTTTELVGRRVEVYVDRDWRAHVTAMKKAHAEINRLDRYVVGDVRDQYKGVTQEMRRIIRHINDLPCHLVLTAQLREEGGRTMPDLPQAIRGDLIGYVDYVIRLEQDGEWPDGRDLVVGFPKPDTGHVAKDRDGILPRRLANPTFTRLLAYSQGELDWRTDPVQGEYRDLLAKRKADDDTALD